MNGYLLVILGATVGAPLRYLTDRWVQGLHATRMPWGTLTVNVVGSLVLGGLTGAAAGHQVMLLAGTGLCGALTTYSTFSFETVRLAEQRAGRLVAANLVISIGLGLSAALAGQAIFS